MERGIKRGSGLPREERAGPVFLFALLLAAFLPSLSAEIDAGKAMRVIGAVLAEALDAEAALVADSGNTDQLVEISGWSRGIALSSPLFPGFSAAAERQEIESCPLELPWRPLAHAARAPPSLKA